MIEAGLRCSFIYQNTIKQKMETKAVKMYQQSNYGYHRNWPILSVQFWKITGYYHTKILLELRKLFVSRK